MEKFIEDLLNEMLEMIKSNYEKEKLDIILSNKVMSQEENNYIIKISKKLNYTIKDLEQLAINYLYKKLSENAILNDADVELFKTIIKN